MPAASILKVLEQKEIKDIEDQTIIMADIARKAINEVLPSLASHPERYGGGKGGKIAQELAMSKYTHDYPLTVE